MYPVHFIVERPKNSSRLQLLVRVIAFMALGVVGVSFGMVFLFAYLALPVFATSRLAASATPEDYAETDGPRVLTVLGWFAAICAWAGLVAESLPGRKPDESVRLGVDRFTASSASNAPWRVLTGLPSALVLAILGWFGVFVWLWAALSILVAQRVGPRTFRYLVGLQRWSIRLLVYQACLVEEYPPFSFEDASSPTTLPRASVV